jgi:hypothetical protein
MSKFKVGCFLGREILIQGSGKKLNEQQMHEVSANHNSHDSNIERIKELEEALMDVIDGYPAYDLVNSTGLSLERCQEIWRIAKGGND